MIQRMSGKSGSLRVDRAHRIEDAHGHEDEADSRIRQAEGWLEDPDGAVI